jgi:hypothetical protein
MKRVLTGLAFGLALTLGGSAFAQQTQSGTPAQNQTTSQNPTNASATPPTPLTAPSPAPPTPPTPALAAPPPAPPPTPAPRGHWTYTADYGWLWIPDGATAVAVDDVPYVYLYTPAYGWTWYVSPWGWGRYYVGDWVLHPWRPHVWHGWVAAPHVVVRLGPGGWHHRW